MATKAKRGHSHTNGSNGKRKSSSPAATGSGNQPLAHRPQDAAPKTVDREFLRARCLELRREGLSYRTIASALNGELTKMHEQGQLTERHEIVGKDLAHALVVEALADLKASNAETAEQVRMIELERLDNWLTRLNSSTKRSEPRVIDTMLRIQERRARLLDLDLATTKIVGADGGPIEISDARSAVLEKLDQLAESLRPQPSMTSSPTSPE